MASGIGSTRRVILSLTGSGHLLVYQLGAARQIIRASKQPSQSSPILQIDHVVGASGGAIAATVLAVLPHRLDEYAQAFIQERGRGMQLLQEFWPDESSVQGNQIQPPPPGLHIATTRCSDGSSKVFQCDNTILPRDDNNKERIMDLIRASCCIPPSFHPLDIVSSPTPYPDHEGIPITDSNGEVEFYVDGGISTPAPMMMTMTDDYDDDYYDESRNNSNQNHFIIIISPVSGTSENTARISPPSKRSGLLSKIWRPFFQIHARHDLGMDVSWNNLRALRSAAGSVSSQELQDWYQRGQDDAEKFLDSWM